MPLNQKKVDEVRRKYRFFSATKITILVIAIIVAVGISLGSAYLITKLFSIVLNKLETWIQFGWIGLVLAGIIITLTIWGYKSIVAKIEQTSSYKKLESNLEEIANKTRRLFSAFTRRIELDYKLANLRTEIAQTESALRGLPPPPIKSYNDEIANIAKLPEYASLTFDEKTNTLRVLTKLLRFEHPENKKTYNLGCYWIELRLNGKDDVIKVFNETISPRTISGVRYQSPYVLEDGHFVQIPSNLQACDNAITYLGRYDIASALRIIINAIKNIDINDNFGKNVTMWPAAIFKD